MKKIIAFIILISALIILSWFGIVSAINYIQPYQISTSSKGVVGTANQVLTIVSSEPTWATPTGGSGGGGLSSSSPFSAGYLPFATSSNFLTNSLIYQSGLNIGIGTTNPTNRLQIIQANDAWGGGIRLQESGGSGYGAGFYRGAGSTGAFIINNNGLDTVAIASGNVGIGTTTPGYKQENYLTGNAYGLVVTRASGAQLGLWADTAAAGIYTVGANNLNFGTAGSNQLTIQSGGNVGIGTTTPNQMLTVWGNGMFNGTLSASSTAYLNALQVTGTATSTFAGPISSASGNFIIAANSANNLLLNPYGGNVGIGTTAPSSTFHIIGSSTITNTLTLGTLNGVLKGTTGIIGVATAGVDYQAPITLTQGVGITIASSSGTWTINNSAPNYNTTTTINGLSGAVLLDGNFTKSGQTIGLQQNISPTSTITFEGATTTNITTANITATTATSSKLSITSLNQGLARINGSGVVTSVSSSIQGIIGDGTNAITLGSDTFGYAIAPALGTMRRWVAIGNTTGTISIDIWKKANYAIPTSTDIISASAPITLNSETLASSTALTGWTTTFSAGDIFGFNVTGTPATLKKVYVSIIYD